MSTRPAAQRTVAIGPVLLPNRGMAALLETQTRSEPIARRGLYRRCRRIGKIAIDVLEPVVYAVVKQS